ncbi:aminotransferase class V-fold PLP-dependent enzyme [Thermoplasma sp.]|uniref:aminotransferase class V-fold PLP-dependent enzyme n=1 Tax=Thermoplasma sp. TaxID=1973142 RepID=UPI00127B989D|nr:aminotransferase class V-fold PLP-dependent enzyme [Thermoplasma sp.]KAA8922006.1 MAG: aminotransferase class V-fold PLP-dependent enzyme [Thermoplasma sp.]
MIDKDNSILSDFLKLVRSMRVVNGIGTMTFLGGNAVSDEVIESMKYVNDIFLNVEELSRTASEYIARRLGVDAAFITAGAASGTVLGIAGLIHLKTGVRYVKDLLEQGRKMIVAVQKPHRSEFRDLIYMAGPSIVEFGDDTGVTEESLRSLIEANSGRILAVMHYAFDPIKNELPLESVIRIAHSYGIPVIVDAAAEIPPRDNLTRYFRMGSDLVLFSGGKMLGGLSNSGLMIGRRDIIQAVEDIGPLSEEDLPEGTRIFIGRPMKVSKETIVSMVVAIENYMNFDENAWLSERKKMADSIAEMISGIYPDISVDVIRPDWNHPRPVVIPRVQVTFHNRISADEISSRLRKLPVPVYTYCINDKLYINPQCLDQDDVRLLVDGLSRVLHSERAEAGWKS